MPSRIEENQIKIDWLPSVASYNDLLALPIESLKDGDCCGVRDEDIHYTWDAPTQSWKSPLKKIILTVTSNTVLTENVTYFLFVDTSYSDIVLTLPSANGFRYSLNIKKIVGSNSLTINTVLHRMHITSSTRWCIT